MIRDVYRRVQQSLRASVTIAPPDESGPLAKVQLRYNGLEVAEQQVIQHYGFS